MMRRAILAALPAIVGAVMFAYLTYQYGISSLVDWPWPAVITASLLAATVPFGILEYSRDRFITRIENEIPTFLSAVEASLIAGLSIFTAYEKGAEHVKTFGPIMKRILRYVAAGEDFVVVVDKLVPGDTSYLKVFREYLKLLAMGGEQLYSSVGEMRKVFEKLTEFKSALKAQARQAAATFLTILGVYVLVLILIIRLFLVELAGTENMLTEGVAQAESIVKALGAYTLYVQGVGAGVVLSVLSGSHRYNMMLLTIVSAFIALVIYSVLV